MVNPRGFFLGGRRIHVFLSHSSNIVTQCSGEKLGKIWNYHASLTDKKLFNGFVVLLNFHLCLQKSLNYVIDFWVRLQHNSIEIMLIFLLWHAWKNPGKFTLSYCSHLTYWARKIFIKCCTYGVFPWKIIFICKNSQYFSGRESFKVTYGEGLWFLFLVIKLLTELWPWWCSEFYLEKISWAPKKHFGFYLPEKYNTCTAKNLQFNPLTSRGG